MSLAGYFGESLRKREDTRRLSGIGIETRCLGSEFKVESHNIKPAVSGTHNPA